MTYSPEAIALRTPDLVELARADERIHYLFLDRVRIEQGRTGLEAWGTDEKEDFVRTAIPCASLAVLALGPGTSITTPALTTLHRAGTTVIITGADGLVSYTVSRPLCNTSKWACAQATLWSNETTRLNVARRMYELRFNTPIPEGTSLATLRGLEGQRVKTVYQTLAAQHKLGNFRRVTLAAEDPVNQNLNLGNSILYGLALTVCHALAITPALGFVHHGRPNSLLYDLADLYKLETAVPVAFKYGNLSAHHSQPFGTALRAILHEKNILRRMMKTTLELLEPGLLEAPAGDQLIADTGYVEGLKNWAEEQ